MGQPRRLGSQLPSPWCSLQQWMEVLPPAGRNPWKHAQDATQAWSNGIRWQWHQLQPSGTSQQHHRKLSAPAMFILISPKTIWEFQMVSLKCKAGKKQHSIEAQALKRGGLCLESLDWLERASVLEAPDHWNRGLIDKLKNLPRSAGTLRWRLRTSAKTAR